LDQIDESHAFRHRASLTAGHTMAEQRASRPAEP
jgi:hypothetical protein